MKITLKTLQQSTFQVEIDENETVRKLKEKIQETKGAEYNADWMKIIYSGKIWADDAILKNCNYDETKFLVVMAVKPKTPPASNTPAESENKTAPKPSGSASETAVPAAPKPESAPQQPAPAAAPAPSAPATPAVAESTVVVGQDYERIVVQLMEMGYDRPEVERALRASFNNPDRAVEYLISGIPAGLGEEAHPEEQAPREGAPTLPAGGANPLEFLMNQPQFQQMRQAVQQNPALLQTLMQQIGRNNPQLLQLITQNQEAFLRMLNEGQPNPAQNVAQAANPPPAGEAPIPGAANLESLIGSAEITQQDKEAIDRLKALGFPEYLVVQAYFACDKNENMAANFLLSQGFDD